MPSSFCVARSRGVTARIALRLASLTALAMLSPCLRLDAQSAQFSGAVSTGKVESIALHDGALVNGSGHAYAADQSNLAVNGASQPGNFGSVNVGSASKSPIAMTFTFVTGGTLGSTAVVTQGAKGLDFTDAGGGTCTANTDYSTNATCTVDVAFAPKAPGARYGAVELIDGSGNLLATGLVRGTGVGPRVNFLPAAISTIAGTESIVIQDVAVDASGDVFVADADAGSIYEIEAVNGAIPASPTINTLVSGVGPETVAVDGNGNVYFADGDNAVKEILAVNGSIPVSPTINTLGSGFFFPEGVAVDGSGNVFVADDGHNAVKEIVAVNGSIPASPTINTLASGFTNLGRLVVDGSGNVFVTDEDRKEIREIVAVNGSIPASPTILTLAIGLNLGGPMAVDGDGNLFIVGGTVSPTGDLPGDVYEMTAVNGSIPASPTVIPIANLNLGSSEEILGMAVDGSGNVFIGAFGGGYGGVEKLDIADPPSLSFATATPVFTTDAQDGTQSVTVINGGNATLSAVAPGIMEPADFASVAGSGTPPDCTASFSLAPGAICNLSVEFAPLSVGNPLSEALVLTDNSLNATAAKQTIQLSGRAIAPTITISPASLPGVTVESAYNQAFTASGGTAPYGKFTVSSGALPPGLMLSPAGVLSGTPTTVGQFSFTVSATDSSKGTGPYSGTQAYQINVGQISQTIDFTALASSVTYGVAPITLSATGGASGNAVTFSILSGPGSIGGNKLTITGVGTVVVAANQLGNADYAAAAQVTQSVVVYQASQTIGFRPPSPVTYGVAPIALAATGGASGNPVTYSVVLGPGSISGSTLTITGAGTVIVAANQLGNADYAAAAQVTQSIVIDQARQTISFNQPQAVTYGAPPVVLSARGGGSGNAVTFSVLSGPGSIGGDQLRIKAAGNIIVVAAQAGDANYLPASPVVRLITVKRALLTFAAAHVSVKYGQPIPKLTYSVKGFVNKETESVLAGKPEETTTAKKGSGPGVYPIDLRVGTLSAANYVFRFEDGTLDITPLGVTDAPTFLPKEGTYSIKQTVTISDKTPGAVIHYTTNGTRPTAASARYTKAITVDAPETTIKAIAIAPGYSESAVSSATYSIK